MVKKLWSYEERSATYAICSSLIRKEPFRSKKRSDKTTENKMPISPSNSFMAIDVLRGVEHSYRHDLESFFYVLLWMCARRAWEIEFQCITRDLPRKSILGRVVWERCCRCRSREAREYAHTDRFQYILNGFAPAFDCIKPLSAKVRRVLFPLTETGWKAGSYIIQLSWITESCTTVCTAPFINAFEQCDSRSKKQRPLKLLECRPVATSWSVSMGDQCMKLSRLTYICGGKGGDFPLSLLCFINQLEIK